MRASHFFAVVAVIAALVLYGHFGPPRFWGDFTGMTEAEARAHLGEPFRDNRVDDGGDVESFRLGWRYFETGLFLKFEDGIVVSQERIGR